MSQIVACLFGGLELRDAHGRELTLDTRKARALLAFLIVERGRWHARDRMASLLWGERSETQARNSLNQAIYEIRKLETATSLGLIERETDRLRLRAESIDCDVHRFETLLSSDPIAAADLFARPLLDGVDPAERQFRDWLDQKRTHYEGALALALRKVAVSTETSQSARMAAARQLVKLVPLDESARRHLMVQLSEAGDRIEAIRQYQICADLLRDELGIDPEPETQEVVAQIRQSRGALEPPPIFAPDGRLDLVEAPPVEDKPVVAVLPFTNLSDDPDLAYFAEGLADDLIFSLSSFRWFRVLARGATFRVRAADPNPGDIRRMFGATHMVSGRVRRAGRRLRMNVDLVDCRTGQQMWAGRYDKTLDDVFDVQDQIARSVVEGIEPTLEDSERYRTLGRPPGTLSAYELLHRGYWHLYRDTLQDHDEAKRCFEGALAKDPNYAGALAALGFASYREAQVDPVRNFVRRLEDCRSAAARALEIDPRDPRALRYFGGASCFLGDRDTALDAVTRSIELCPSYASAYSGLAFVHDFRGNFSEATPAADETVRLRPHDSVLHKCIVSKAIAHYQTADYERAERIAKASVRTNSSWWLSNMVLAASLAQRGRLSDAGAAAQRLRADQPDITLEIMLQWMPFADPAHTDHLAEGLIRAGWSD